MCIWEVESGSFPSGGKRAKHILEIVHSDVFGPVKVPSLGKSVYYVSFIDDFSRNTWIYFLKKKSKVFVIFNQQHIIHIHDQIMVESFARRNLKNFVRSVV